jgi:hypothetical protein
MFLQELQIERHQLLQPLLEWLLVSAQKLFNPRYDRELLGCRPQDIVFGAEVVIEKSVGDTGRFGDVLHGRAFHTLLEEQGDGCTHEFLTTLIGRSLPGL